MTETTAEKYIAALDVGTTTIRCQVFNSKAEPIAQASTSLKLLYPQPGFVEINPDVLWSDVVQVVKQAIQDAGLQVENVSCIGVAAQRATFITWRKDTGVPFHNFITWKDLRATNLVKEWNGSMTMKGFRSGAYFLYLFTRNKRFLAGGKLTLTNIQVTLRLNWILENIPELKIELQKNNVLFGTLDTWLTYKLTDGKTFVTDYTSASSTGMFDPFVFEWGSWAHLILNVPKAILPKPVPNDYKFGATDAKIFGASIPITCLIADQQASMFGSCCFGKDILKVTLGTGTFLNIQTDYPCIGEGFYPLIAFKSKDSTSYIAEGSCNDTGSLIQWALRIGLCEDPSHSSSMAFDVDGNDGVYFIPAFSGLGPPISDDNAASGFIGVKATTRKEHMVRAILESIVFRIVLQYDSLKKDLVADVRKIYVDGGVSKNNFVCQMLADMMSYEVERPVNTEMSAMGIAYIAGLNSGIWKSKDQLLSLRRVDKVFIPTSDTNVKNYYHSELRRWHEAVDRFSSWYSQ